MPTRTLEMTFGNASGRNVTIRVPDANSDLTGNEVKTAMDLIIVKNIFTSAGGDLATQIQARIVVREVQELELV